MGLDFHVQLLVAQPGADVQPDGPSPKGCTVIRMPDLGNAAIRRAMTPLMTLTDKGYVPHCGELPIDVGTPAFARLEAMAEKAESDYRYLSDQLSDQRRDDWSEIYDQYQGLSRWKDILDDNVRAIRAAADNDAITPRIVWC